VRPGDTLPPAPDYTPAPIQPIVVSGTANQREATLQTKLAEAKRSKQLSDKKLADAKRDIERLNYDLHVEKTSNSRATWEPERKKLVT
jgi:hypothetical protein